MARFSLKWLFVGVTAVALMITAVKTANFLSVTLVSCSLHTALAVAVVVACLSPDAGAFAFGYAAFGALHFYMVRETPPAFELRNLVAAMSLTGKTNLSPDEVLEVVGTGFRTTMFAMLWTCVLGLSGGLLMHAISRKRIADSCQTWWLGVAVTLLLGLGLAAVEYPTFAWAVAMNSITYAALAAALCVGRANGPYKGFATGFATFGIVNRFSADYLWDNVARIAFASVYTGTLVVTEDTVSDTLMEMRDKYEHVQQIAYLSWTAGVGCIGGCVGQLIYHRKKARAAKQ